jgi:DNA polymerase bacteriophage-type
LRLASSGTACKKYNVIADACGADGRMRGTIQFCGAARTGRGSGKIFQPQNLPRPTFKANEIEKGIEYLKADCADLIYENVYEMATSAIRGLVIAPKGKKLVISDLSAIEGRVLAWLAGEEWKVEAYYDLDKKAIDFDMYVLAYSKTFNVPPESVTKKQRQLGKTLELALGYAGGVGAFVTFANNFGIDLEEMAKNAMPVLHQRAIAEAEAFYKHCVEEKKTLGLSRKVFVACDAVKRSWREANPKIVEFWADIEQSVRNVIEDPTRTESVGFISVDKKGNWLRIRLPSGRYLCYAGASIDAGKIKYLGVNQYSRKWGKLSTYSGKIVENTTQAVARDILFYSMPKVEAAGYEILLSVHDEIISECPDSKE